MSKSIKQIPAKLTSIELSNYAWHSLLSELEDSLRICNRDNTNVEILYENIASQLAGRPVKVSRPEKQKVKPLDKPPENPVKTKSFWRKFWK